MPNDAAQDRELLKRLLKEEKQLRQPARITAAKEKLHLKKRPANLRYLPLSFAQEALWFVDRINPGEAGYNSLLTLKLTGKLSFAALIKTLETLQQRHEVLRTCFVETDEAAQIDADGMEMGIDNSPVTAVGHDKLDLPLTELDISQQSDVPGQLDRLLQSEMGTPFDLSRAPLYRAMLVKIDDADHRLILTVHHIISDGWSTGVLYGEFCQIYRDLAAGREISLTPVVQYLDYAIAQRDYLTKEVLDKQLAYWKKQLSDVPQLDLPKDHPRSAAAGYQGISKSRKIPAASSEALRMFSRQQGVTVFVYMLSVFNLLMHRYSGQDDIVIGSPLVTRNSPELEKLIGLLINMAVLRIQVQPEVSFRSFLKSNRKMMLDAQDNSDLPFNYLVKALQPSRQANVNPFFQVVFAQDMAASPVLNQEYAAGQVSIQVSGRDRTSVNKITRFDVEAFVKDDGRDLGIEFVCNNQLFDETTVERMLDSYMNLLAAAVAEPDKPIGLLPILSRIERQLLLEQWNQNQSDYTSTRTLSELFGAQASHNPEAVAVECAGETLSYSELDSRSNQLARFLLSRGVVPEVRVGLYLEPSLNLLVAILGILKAGGAYVPLDPQYPRQRLEFILEDCAAQLLLTQKELRTGLADYRGELICLDADWSIIEMQDSNSLPTEFSADNTAYVIYTSGSTGQPKGVMVTHSNVTRLFAATEQWYGFSERDVWTLFHSSAFDFSVWEIWGALLYGGRLVVVPYATSRSPDLFYDLLVEAGVTVLNQTPSAFYQLMKADEARAAESLSALRLVIFGGEALNPQSLGSWFEKHGDRQPRLVNMYGITETTVHVTYRPLTSSLAERGASVIGRAIPDLQIYILDRYRQPVPIGVPGEMYIGGAGLARGYLNRPDLTAERFIAHPFSDRADARLYKTGDLARYLPDGDIEFLGRIDHQVKLRGFRIELGEIETVLARHVSVRDAVAILREDETGDRRLVAYVLPTFEWMEQNPQAQSDVLAGPLAGERLHHELIPGLRRQVREHLPDYMLPSVFVVLDEFPLNANGKLDRQALPDPGDIRSSLEVRYAAPRNEIEQRLADIWADVLRLETVGIHDNFFDLGGHSLKMTQVVSRLRQQLNIELPLSEMFGNPTVVELEPVVELLLDKNNGDEVNIIEAVDRTGDLPLSFSQERLWFLDQLDPESIAYNIPLALRLKGELDVAGLRNSLNTIVRRQEALRTHFKLHQGKPIQIIEEVTLELAQDDFSALASETQEREVKIRVDEEASQPFDLSAGPLLRGSLLRLSEREHVLLLTMHHIVSDGWSLGILFRELGACYAAFSEGKQPRLPELPIQYADFAVWQRDWLSGEVLDSQMAYWQETLSNLPILDLPTDRVRPTVQTYAGASETLALDAELTEQLGVLSKQSGVTLFMTLLGAFAVLMHRYSGQDDVVIGSPIANRNRSEVEGLIGFFINNLVMRLPLSGDPGFRELLGRVQETALGAYQHQDIPFEKLVEVLQPERDRSRNPLFQVQFALQNAPMEPLQLKGLILEPISREVQMTRFDLECHLWEKGGGLEIYFVYNRDLFDADSIRRMLAHYRNLLQAVVAEPDRRIAELAMLDAEERQQLEDWNRTATDYPRDKTVHELFEAQAVASPDAVAVEYAGETLSYAELNERANQLAHYLQSRGVGPEVMVGVYLERGLDLVVGLLGILKAGGAYVPLDLDYPPSRISFMLEDAGVPVLLSVSGLREQLPDFAGELVCLDRDWAGIEQESAANPASSASADNLAYVIYTSGSTGTPKGVEIPHRAINRLVRNTDFYPVEARDRIAQASNVSFDAATFEIWGALLNGAQLVGVDKETLLNSQRLAVFLQEQGISAMFLTTALFNQIAREAPDAFKGLSGLMFGGEAVDPGAVRQVLAKAPPERLLHVYGPTESTTFASWQLVEEVAADAVTVPIGRPLANTTLYILDKDLNPVPVGVPGELYIGGDGLARGYLKRPELSAERFVVDPRQPERRLYRTGDQVRYRADGAIEYLGRFDHQVKLRGFRVEPGEIESVLLGQPAVSEAVVIVHEDESGDKRLVAYVVADGGDAPTESELRELVAERLPSYMVPSAFMLLDRLVLTANGKVDRDALPEPGDIRSQGGEYTAPRTALEQQLAQIWAEVLKLERVGIDDNFFDLGGHSLMATQAVSRIREQLSIELPLSEMFDYPTVAELAEFMEDMGWVNDDTAAANPDSDEQRQVGEI